MAPVSPTDPAELQRRVGVVVFLTIFLDLIGYGLVIPLLPLYVESMGGGATMVGFILSSFAVTQLIATPILGRLSDRYGRRRVILISLIGNAAAMGVLAAATTLKILPLVFISRIFAGATAGNMSACQAAIADVTEAEERARGMGKVGAAIGLGMVFGPVLGGALSHIGTWAPPIAAAAMALVALALAYFQMPETRWHRQKAAEASGIQAAPTARWTLAQVLTVRPLLFVFALYFLVFMTMTNTQVSLALLVKERFGWTEKEVGYIFGAFGAITIVMQGGLIGRLSRRFGEVSLLVVGSALCGAGMASLGLAYDPVTGMVGCVLFSVGMGICNPSLSSLASRLAPPDQVGTVLGFAQSSGGLARTIGPSMWGLMYQQLGSAAPFLGGAFASLIGVGVALTFRARSTSPSAAASPSP